MKYTILFAFLFIFLFSDLTAQQKDNQFELSSPDGNTLVTVSSGAKLAWKAIHDHQEIIQSSTVSLHLANHLVLGENNTVLSSKKEIINEQIIALNYKKDTILNSCNQLTIYFKGNYAIQFRAYNEGIAYRFITSKTGNIIIENEEANFNFTHNCRTFIPYANGSREKDKFEQSFEAVYDEPLLSEIQKDSLIILPLLVDLGNHKKAVITEADLEDYPGMYITANPATANGLKAVFAPYPAGEKIGGYHTLNYVSTGRLPYIASTGGSRTFPWRILVISDADKDLANNDMVQKLASPSRISNTSWIKPGKVAWDWWNDWNITHVDFKSGINTETYKYYSDFASANQLEYLILDEGWSLHNDLLHINPQINLGELVSYANQKHVGLILWSSVIGMDINTDSVLSKYAAMGIKGFKVDFFDRDDQLMVDRIYTIAAKAAAHQMLLDLHGMYKPTGIQRTFPNILNFEGVKGMENVKWSSNLKVPAYDVSIPFIRMLAGPMDYTPGAMRNATSTFFRPNNALPMSQGTRCHQMAMYTVFEAPLQMLADNPTIYTKEQECTSFISKVPTVFNETVALDGQVGAFIAIARRKENNWFVGAMTNWTARVTDIRFSFLGEGNYEAEVFKDGINADKDATDYKKEIIQVNRNTILSVKMAPGGGWTARVYPVH